MKTAILLVCLFVFVPTSCTFAEDSDQGNGKDYGVAVNPVLALFGWVSSEFNIWKVDRTGEINIPAQFAHDPFWFDEGDYSVDLFSIGMNYRKFFDKTQEGFFVQGGVTYYYAGVDGRGSAEGKSASSSQTAVLFGFGYRLISQTNGLFWAFGLGAGRRWGTIEDTLGDEIQDDGLAIAIDFLKIGYAW